LEDIRKGHINRLKKAGTRKVKEKAPAKTKKNEAATSSV
jgi:hypothetical protein